MAARTLAILLALGACTSAESARPDRRPAAAASPTGASVLAPPERILPTTFPRPQRPQSPPPPERYVVRGVYGRDASATGVEEIRASGFNAVTVQPYRSDLDDLQRAGMKGIVWLWGYDDDTCTFHHSDDQIRDEVARIAGHPAILAYQIDDEPNYARTRGCPGVPTQIRNRSRLVKSIDPGATTYVVVSTYDGVQGFPYEYFAGATDIMGLDVYPYSRHGADPDLIDRAIREANKDRVPRYWAILQDFSDGYYVTPTAAQLREQFARWRRSRMEGYFVYHWNLGGIEDRPTHLRIYARENARAVPSRT